MSEKKKRPRIDRNLSEEEIQYYYTLLDESITDYDCGDLCKDANGGVPYCCQSQHAVPLLYKNEYKHLRNVGDLWHEWRPVDADDKKLKETEGDDQIFCECKGVQHCIRDQRSISCRTFPLEPYLDRRGVLVGLTFIRDFVDKDPDTGRIKCPLSRKKQDIRQDFIDSHFIFWEKLMLRKEDEYETYLETSKSLRREKARTGRRFEILYPTHLLNSKTAKRFIY
ncbi:MAG: hypothetical protein CMN77_07410 [Spirochaetaceae bacterium]|nr:hypothetical protein [Spirochaetaceae bacterium]|tara:strand:+ start:23032 stop:23703 length:672 start_codon:yes stop_codon:yes gene_type:complete